mmetsp:Transcript_13264/g.25934  ORF Transcript_13264/g.25934 Transcript_13264/m.25934 type:complete len:545 (+) Transcript_13264:79-1713(+)
MHSRAVISLLSIVLLCCLLKASGQNYLLEHLAVMIFGMGVGLVSAFYLGENEDMMLLEFNQESFFVILAPPIFLEAGYNMNRKLFFDHSIGIFMLGIVGTYVNAILFAVCFYCFVSYVHPCGLLVGDSFTMEDAIHLAALIAPTDVVAVLSIFKSIPSTPQTVSLISITEGESLVNDGVGIVLFWHTGHAFPDELLEVIAPGWGTRVGVVLVPLIFIISIILGITVAIICALTTTYTTIQTRPQVEFLITVAFAYLSYFISVPIPVVSEFISLFSCGFALAHFNEGHLSMETRTATKTLFKSWGWVAETFIFFQIGVNTTVSINDDMQAWGQGFSVLLLVLFLMVFLRAIVVFLACTYLNCYGYEKLFFKQQVVLNLASVRGAVSYALCLVWPNVANAEIIHTTTLGVVLFTNFIFGSALGPVVRALFPVDSQGEEVVLKDVKEDNVSPRRTPYLRGTWSVPEDIDRDYRALSNESFGESDSSWLARFDREYIRPFLTRVRSLRNLQAVVRRHDLNAAAEEDDDDRKHLGTGDGCRNAELKKHM